MPFCFAGDAIGSLGELSVNPHANRKEEQKIVFDNQQKNPKEAL